MSQNAKFFISFFIFLLMLIGVYGQDKKRIDSLNKILLEVAEDTNRIYTLCELTAQYASIDAEKALGYANEALRISKKIKHKYSEGYALNMIGYIYDYQSEFDKATDFYLQSLKIKEEIGDQSGIAASYQNLGVLAYFQGDLDKALQNYQEALDIKKSISDKDGVSLILNNIGIVYRKQKLYDKALDSYKEALQIKKELNKSASSIAATIQNIGVVYQYKGDYQKARQYLEESLFLEEKANNCYGITGSWIALGILYSEENKIEEAKELLSKGLEISQDCNTKDFQLQAYQLFIHIDTTQNNYREAFYHQQKYLSIIKELYTTQKAEAIVKYQTIYETEKKENETKLQKKENEILRDRLYLGVLGALLIFLFLLFLYVQARNKAQKRRLALEKAEAQKLQVEAENRANEEEKLRLTEEVKAQQEIAQLKEEKLRTQIDSQNRELSSFSLNMVQKNQVFSTLKEQLERLQVFAVENENLAQRLKELLKIIKNNLNADADWEKFKLHFEQVHPQFFKKIQDLSTEISGKELKFCAYLKLNLDTKEIAGLLDMTVRSVESYKYRIKKKLNLQEESNLQDYLLGL